MKTIATVLALLLLGAVGACHFLLYPTYTYRYRLTLEVEMPDGAVRTGSSVVEVSSWRVPPWSLPPGAVRLATTGEATPIDLGEGRLLVALLTGQFPYRAGWGEKEPTGLLTRVYGVLYEWTDGRNPGLERLTRQRGPREIGPGDLPRLVTFADPADPRSVEAVDPNDLAKTFGAGVRLRRATIEVTGDPVTEGVIEQRLPWLRGMRTNLAGRMVRSSNDLPDVLIPLDFRRQGL